ncbi:alpha-L-rhamnosidase [Streptomyces sp. DvalAA-14]|uniref:ricin-type beta-trefoil lectin domain protein n=1 Tax=unclassified Streptomyces TaxID=2593676 RepID=UPI00081B0EEC|nr:MULTISPECIES: ricin-type beta-trefoil lectin domain protein [unclassified Streptomyces]MYS24014.1 glycogen debranching protein [Streptomyces sp. SID4948]SCE41544.1 alpha-L-rhamnosidase [Streptomyces sp. DvalAA-14]
MIRRHHPQPPSGPKPTKPEGYGGRIPVSGVPRRRSRLLVGLGALALAAAGVSGVGHPGATAAAATGAPRPTLTFANGTTQSTLGAAYTKALTNLLDTNTVSYDPSVYNSSGLMTSNPQTFIRAGGGYAQPWTRDAAVNSWNAASLLEPKQAANTLWSAVVKQSNGQLIVQQDNEQWDQVVWAIGAWNHYLVTGDQSFLTNAYQATTNTLNTRKSANYNSSYGLFQGPAFFNDGIAGYPAPPADATESHGGYVGDYAATSTMMTLSTNAVYYQAYRSAALMAAALGKSASEVNALNSQADSLKSAINNHLWNAGKGLYGYFVHGNDSLSGQLDPTEEGTGLSFAILFGIASPAQAQSILANAHLQPNGIVDTYPNYARYSDAQPGRHNVVVWPMVEGYWADAAAQSGNQPRFANEVQNLARLANTSGQFAEIYNAQTGAVDGGWQTGGHWGAAPDQTWSATAYLRMIDNDLFGLNFTTGGITFKPTLPAGWGDATLSGVQYRGATLTIALHGAGNVVSSFKLDGAASTANSVPASLTGTHTVDITLTGSQPTPATGTILSDVNSNKCADDNAGSSANGTHVQMWDCNSTPAQTWTRQADGTIRINGACLDVQAAGTADGTPVQLYTCNGTGAQQWTVTNGTLVNPASGKCLDDPGGNTANGTQLLIWTCDNGNNQHWAIP